MLHSMEFDKSIRSVEHTVTKIAYIALLTCLLFIPMQFIIQLNSSSKWKFQFPNPKSILVITPKTYFYTFSMTCRVCMNHYLLIWKITLFKPKQCNQMSRITCFTLGTFQQFYILVLSQSFATFRHIIINNCILSKIVTY